MGSLQVFEDMDTHTALKERATVQKFRNDPIPEKVRHRALEAAHWAPNHKLTFPWRFLELGPEVRTQLAQLNVGLKAKGRTLTAEEAAPLRAPLLNPGWIVAVTCRKSSDTHRWQEDYGACACAVQNLMLSLWADGFGSKWATGPVTSQDTTYRLLGINPTEDQIIGFIFAGLPAGPVQRPARPPWTEFVRQIP